jgi:hypothetical protein
LKAIFFTNFNSIARGNAQLENSLVSSHRLNYSKYNLYNFTTIFGSIRYQNPVVNVDFISKYLFNSERLNLDAENEILTETCIILKVSRNIIVNGRN